jgi:hypothetical protein
MTKEAGVNENESGQVGKRTRILNHGQYGYFPSSLAVCLKVFQFPHLSI